MARTVVGHFQDTASADAAYEQLVQHGFNRDDITVIGRGQEGKKGAADLGDHVTAGEGAAAGTIFGLLFGAAAMLIPGIGPVIAVGPLTAAVAGAVTGGVTGAIVGGVGGALIHAGVPEEEARYYEDRFKTSGYLVTVRTEDDRYEEARRIFAEASGDLGPSAGNAVAASAKPPTGRVEGADATPVRVVGDDGPQRLELREEQLVVHKEMRDVGEVRVSKHVVEVPQSVQAQVFHDEVGIQRVPVNQVVPERVAPWEEDGVYVVPVYEEQLVLVKQLVLKEQVRIERTPVPQTQEFQETVRREQLVMDDPRNPALTPEQSTGAGRRGD
jgi:uncharacterized protein (TIGR02271 family)